MFWVVIYPRNSFGLNVQSIRLIKVRWPRVLLSFRCEKFAFFALAKAANAASQRPYLVVDASVVWKTNASPRHLYPLATTLHIYQQHIIFYFINIFQLFTCAQIDILYFTSTFEMRNTIEKILAIAYRQTLWSISAGIQVSQNGRTCSKICHLSVNNAGILHIERYTRAKWTGRVDTQIHQNWTTKKKKDTCWVGGGEGGTTEYTLHKRPATMVSHSSFRSNRRTRAAEMRNLIQNFIEKKQNFVQKFVEKVEKCVREKLTAEIKYESNHLSCIKEGVGTLILKGTLSAHAPGGAAATPIDPCTPTPVTTA